MIDNRFAHSGAFLALRTFGLWGRDRRRLFGTSMQRGADQPGLAPLNTP
jgi:hypothetical protein